jgi:arylsulfatase A
MLDAAMGKLLAALDETGMADNTLFLFTSDNGAHWLPDEIERWDHRANAHLRGQKADIWEGGHRVAMLARWPGRIRPGSVSDATTCHTDFLATIAEVVGARLGDDAGEDSFSFAPALFEREATGPVRDGTVHHSSQGRFAIRRGVWKLHLGLGSGGFTPPQVVEPGPGEPPGELFNLSDDPSESTNLYAERPEIVKELTELLERYRSEGRSRPRSS